MNLRQAQYILAVWEEKSISRAAKKLYITQPSLSQMIHNIEQELNIKLFHRQGHPLTLTYAGEKYIDAARQLLSLHRNLITKIQEINQENHGRLRLGISIHRAMTLLPKILPLFRASYPQVDLQLIEDSAAKLEQLALEEQLDLAFVNPEHKTDKLTYTLIQREQMVLFASRHTALAKRHPSGTAIPISEAKNEPFISLHKGHGIRTVQDRMFYEYDLSPPILLETHSAEVARRLAIACQAVTIYPETTLGDMEDLTANATYFPILGEQFKRDFYLCHHKNMYLTRFMRDFITLAQHSFQPLLTAF